MKRAVITGATGAVGMALIEKLIGERAEVLVLCRKNSVRAAQIPKHPLICRMEADLSDLSELENTTGKEWDIFYHLAWSGTIGEERNDARLQMKNALYTLDAVRLAQRFGCHTFVGAGSQAEYGRFEGRLNESVPVFPETGYGIAKLAAGQMSRLLCKQLHMRHIWARILSIYGPYDGKQTMVMTTIEKLLRGEKPSFTKGEQKWDYLYSKDAAKALYLLGEKGTDGRTYCLGSGQAKPLYEYIMQIREAIPEAKNIELGLGEIPYGPGQVMHLCADIALLTEDTGFLPEFTFAQGIRDTVEFVRKQSI